MRPIREGFYFLLFILVSVSPKLFYMIDISFFMSGNHTATFQEHKAHIHPLSVDWLLQSFIETLSPGSFSD